MPATIVGTPEGRVVGTAGDDVIVSGGAWSVKAGDGDDLVCIPPMEGDLLGNVVEVDAGAGDDTVVSEGEHNNSDVTLGPGVDTFRGGGWEDRVEAGFEDTVVADRGDDFVNYSIKPGEALPATVGSTVANRSSGWIKVTAPGRSIAIDGKAGEVRVDGRVVTTFGISPRMLFGVAQRVELVGSSGVDRLAAGACGLGVVKGRGGDDDILYIRDDALPRKSCDPADARRRRRRQGHHPRHHQRRRPARRRRQRLDQGTQGQGRRRRRARPRHLLRRAHPLLRALSAHNFRRPSLVSPLTTDTGPGRTPCVVHL